MSWARCAHGHLHWGRRGAAGLLLARHGTVLLQLRAGWVHRGGTWALPGGAIEQGETPVEAALRESSEELGIDPTIVAVRGSRVARCGGWAYETVLGEPVDATLAVDVRANGESAAHRWVDVDDVGDLGLHPAFRSAWEDPDAVLREFVARTGETPSVAGP